MPTIHDEVWKDTLTTDSLKKYIASDPSIINRADGNKNLTPLGAACLRGNFRVVKILLAERADPDAISSLSRTPLYFVTAQSPISNRFEILRALIDASATIDMVCDKDGNTPLMNAVSQTRDKRVVKELVDRGASQTIENNKKETAAMLANKRGMARYLRPKSKRNSGLAQVVDVIVSLVLLVVSYTDSGFLKSTMRGVMKKLFNFGGAVNPELAKEIPKPSSAEQFKTSLNDYVRGKFEKFFPKNDPFLQNLAINANRIREDPDTDLGNPKNLKRLSRLALYRTVILCDDSGSMGLNDLFTDQLALVRRIARIATWIVPKDHAGVDLRFINAAGSDRLKADEIEKAIKDVKPRGGTPIGTSLRSKILQPLVYDAISTRTLKRPILVCIITDGAPSEEEPDTFKKNILECKKALDAAEYDPASVVFLVSQIGSDDLATEFLASLRKESTIKDVLYCTSDRLDDKFRELKEKERVLESWLLRTLVKAFMERHEE